MQDTNVKLHVKGYEATYLESLIEKLTNDSPDKNLHRVTQLMHPNQSQRLDMAPSTACALIDALLDAWTGQVSESETEQQIADDLLDRLELPGEYGGPMEYAKAHKNMPTFGSPLSHDVSQHRASKRQLGI